MTIEDLDLNAFIARHQVYKTKVLQSFKYILWKFTEFRLSIPSMRLRSFWSWQNLFSNKGRRSVKLEFLSTLSVTFTDRLLLTRVACCLHFLF